MTQCPCRTANASHSAKQRHWRAECPGSFRRRVYFPVAAECDKIRNVKPQSQPRPLCAQAAFPLEWRLLRLRFHDKAGDFLAALVVRLLSPSVVRAPLLAALALAGAALLSIPAGEARAHPNGPYHYEDYPLHAVAAVGGPWFNHRLTAHEFDVNEKDGVGNTPLHVAGGYSSSRLSVVNALIALGADVNAKNNAGNTPMHYAGGSRSVVNALVAAGADVNAENNNGHTPLRATCHPGVCHQQQGKRGHRPVLIAAGGHWGESCAGPLVVNPNHHNPPCLCQSPNVGTADNCQPPMPSAQVCGGLTPAKFYSATLSACIPFKSCPSGAALNREINTCEFSAGSCGELTPPQFYDGAECVPFNPCGGGALDREANTCECAGAAVLDSAGMNCLCESPNVGTPAACAVPSITACAGLNPPEYYAATLSVCVPFADCQPTAEWDGETNTCKCAPPSALDGTGLGCEFTSASCMAATLHYTGTDCEPLADCTAPAVRNEGTNLCECLAPNLDFGGGDCRAPSAANCAEYGVAIPAFGPPRLFDPTTGECGDRLFPCHDSAIVKADNSGCECPAGAFAHKPHAGGRWSFVRPEWRKYGTAECHADHAPIQHTLQPGDWLAAVRANNPAIVAHFISGHKWDPDAGDALHAAAAGGHHQAAKVLIEGGADIHRKRNGASAPACGG